MASNNYDIHRFFCMNCGEESIPLPRRHGKKHEKFHRKKLYCIHCREYCNHVECKNEIEVEKFKEDYKDGVYREEAEESLAHVRGFSFG